MFITFNFYTTNLNLLNHICKFYYLFKCFLLISSLFIILDHYEKKLYKLIKKNLFFFKAVINKIVKYKMTTKELASSFKFS